LPIHTEKVDSPYWKKLTTFPEQVLCKQSEQVRADSFAKNVDFVRILLTLHTVFVYFVLSWLTRLRSAAERCCLRILTGKADFVNRFLQVAAARFLATEK
jgi:hypothetical protein